METGFYLLLGFMPYKLGECSHLVEMILNEKKKVAWLFCILKKIHILEEKVEAHTEYQLKSSGSDETTCPHSLWDFLRQIYCSKWKMSGVSQAADKKIKTSRPEHVGSVQTGDELAVSHWLQVQLRVILVAQILLH